METSQLYRYFLECGKVTTDTRDCSEGSMFIALKGASFNGNVFARQALAQGCRYAVVDEDEYADDSDGRILLVDDCLVALQRLAAWHRRVLRTVVIGITGTNGKTTTKELLASVLKEKYNVLYTQGNLNNHIGVPLTLLRLTQEHEMAVIEMGASHPGEIRELAEMAHPDYGIITNVGKAHLQGFGSLEGVLHTKGELYDFIRHNGGKIFIQNGNPYLRSIADGLECVRYGTEDGLYVSGKVLSCSPFLSLSWKAEGETHQVQTRLIGSYNLDNALAAVAVGRYFGVADDDICRALSTYEPHNNRSQLVEAGGNSLVIDAYNANPTSMAAALENFRMMDAAHKMVILGDMKELGEASLEEHQKVVDILAGCGFDRVALIGPEFGRTVSPYAHYIDADEAYAALSASMPVGYTILVKGSNGMKLSALAEKLMKRT